MFDDVTAKSKNRKLNLSLFQKCLIELGYSNFSFSTCKLLLTMFDKNKNHNLSKIEFVNVCSYVEKWKDCFHAYDSDNNGCIDIKELKVAITTFGYKFSEPFYASLLKKFDKNGSGTISFDEFIQLFGELHVLTEEFKKHDTRRSGLATFEYEDFLQACFTIKQ